MAANYPTANPAITTGANDTGVTPTTWNRFVDETNAIGADLVLARADTQEFPQIDHTAGQARNITEALDAIRHMIAQLSGQTNFYDDFSGSLKVHTHASGQGGAIPWSSIASNARFLEIHPEYPGAVWTTSLFGGAASGNNTTTNSVGQDVTSNVARNYYEATSAEASLQDYYVAVQITLPENFTAFATSNAIQIDYITESEVSINSKFDVYVYKSGSAGVVTSALNNVSTSWAQVTIDDSSLGSWSAGDVMCIYLKLNTRSNYYTRVGKIKLNYTS